MEWTNLEKALNEYGKAIVENYRSELEHRGKNASGALSSSVKFKVEKSDTVYEVSLNLKDYWKYIESGRKPGKWPPVSAIERWIKVKPVIPRPFNGKVPSEKQLAFLISRKIAQKGIKPEPVLETAKNLTNEQMLDKVADAFMEDCGKDIDEVLTLFKTI